MARTSGEKPRRPSFELQPPDVLTPRVCSGLGSPTWRDRYPDGTQVKRQDVYIEENRPTVWCFNGSRWVVVQTNYLGTEAGVVDATKDQSNISTQLLPVERRVGIRRPGQ